MFFFFFFSKKKKKAIKLFSMEESCTFFYFCMIDKQFIVSLFMFFQSFFFCGVGVSWVCVCVYVERRTRKHLFEIIKYHMGASIFCKFEPGLEI